MGHKKMKKGIIQEWNHLSNYVTITKLKIIIGNMNKILPKLIEITPKSYLLTQKPRKCGIIHDCTHLSNLCKNHKH